MRKQLFAMASSVAIAVATVVSGIGPAGAIQVAPDTGTALGANIDLAQFQSRGDFRGNAGARFSGRSGGFSGNVGARSFNRSGNFNARISRGNFNAPRASVQRNFVQRDFNRGNFQARRDVQVRRDLNRRDFARADRRWDGNRRWDGDRRWDRGDWRRHRGHAHWWRNNYRFLGAVIVGVPFGYAAASSHPCYDWLYGPQGWGYYWNYDRCPV